MEVFAEVRQHLEAGIPATNPVVQKTLMQWGSLFADAWGGDIEVMKKVRNIHMQEQELSSGGGLTPELLNYARTGMQFLEQNRQKTGAKK
ncbi:MAG: MerR family transcriptional regulator [Pseudomonadota bacterium]